MTFHQACVSRIEQSLKVDLVKQSRASFVTPDGSVKLVCSVSRFHERAKRYWFAFHPHQDSFLKDATQAYVAYGCGDADTLFLIPYGEFRPWLGYFSKTELADRSYWHVKIKPMGGSFQFKGRAGTKDFDITKYKI